MSAFDRFRHTNHRHPAQRHWSLRSKLALVAALLLVCSCDGGNGDPGTGGDGTTGPAIKVTVTSPVKDAYLAGFITITGTIDGGAGHSTTLVIKGKDSCKLAEDSPLNAAAASADPDVLKKFAERYSVAFKDITADADAVRAALAAKLKTLKDGCKATGTTFSIPFASQQHDDKDKPLFKDGKLTVTVGVKAANDANGSGSVGVNVDNALPGIEILEPAAGSAHIQKVTVRGRITEKNLDDVGLWVVGAFSGDPVKRLHKCDTKAPADSPINCKKCEEINKPLGGTCVSKAGVFKFELDRGPLPTADVTLTLIARDSTQRTKQLDTKIKMLRPPLYDVAFPRTDPGVTSLVDYKLHDYTGDGVLDLVLCGEGGVFVRAAKVVPESNPPKGTADWHPAIKISSMACRAVDIVDLDPHPCAGDAATRAEDIKDIVALGAGEGGEGSLLQAFLVRKGAPAPKFMQQIPLKGTAGVFAVGQMDGKGPLDLVVGSKEDETALSTFLALENGKCPLKDQPDILCRDVKDLKGHSKADLLSAPLIHKMLGKIEQIAVGDFYQLDGESRPDVVVGRGIPVVSVCPNLGGGTYLACIDTGETGGLVGYGDSSRMVVYNWTTLLGKGDTIPDLVIGSKTGPAVRWLRGLPDGTFKFEKLPLPNGQIGPHQWLTGGAGPLTIAPIGVVRDTSPILDRCGAPTDLTNDARGAPYVVEASPKASHFFDMNGSLEWFRTTCDHSWILGNSVVKVLAGDVDNDGTMDLTALNAEAPVGITVARGKSPFLSAADKKNGTPTHQGITRFHAADVYRVCGRTDGIYTAVTVGRFVVGNTDTDSNPDLVIGSNGTESSSDGCKNDIDSAPAHMFHIYRNNGTNGLDLAALAMEYAPYTDPTKSGATKHGCGLSFGKLVGLELANLNGGRLDLVFATQTEYTHGKTPDDATYFDGSDPDIQAAGEELPGGLDQNLGCFCQEHYEVHNLFSEDSEGDDLNCVVLNDIDWNDKDFKTFDKKKPVKGYGPNGAPVERASLLYVLNEATSDDPFILSKLNTPQNPKLMVPNYAQAGGRGIVDMAIVDIDGDGDHDVATVMGATGGPTEQCHLAPRVRVFETATDGGPHAKAHFYMLEGSSLASMLKTSHFKDANKFRIISMPKDSLSFYQPLHPETGAGLAPNYVTYRVVSPDPFDIISAQFCLEQTTYRLDPNGPISTKNIQSLFVLGRQEHDFCLLKPKAHQYPGGIGGSNVWSRSYFDRGLCLSLGDGLQGFSVRDVLGKEGQDSCNDVVYAKKNGMGVLPGAAQSFLQEKEIFATNSTRSAIDTLDVNQDGFLDVLALDSDQDTVQVLLGDGKGSFVEEKRRVAGLKSSSTMRVADFDLDKCADLVVQAEFGVAVYRNLGCD